MRALRLQQVVCVLEASGAPMKVYQLPKLFVLDHLDRAPCDDPDQMAELVWARGPIACIKATDGQLDNLLSDAKFYADGNVDGCCVLVRSARSVVQRIKAIRKAKP